MSGLDRMKKRMLYEGGGLPTSDGRYVETKLKSFKVALKNSYQAEDITFNNKQYRCLITEDKVKENYDLKILSIDWSAGITCGDTFYWNRTDTNWLVCLQHLTEESYFRAEIRRCDYKLGKYWVYVRGPVETTIQWEQKHQIEFNRLNYSLLVYITKNEETENLFKRFSIIKFDGHRWRVAATDKYSQKGIIEAYLEEYFDNTPEDEAMVVPEIKEQTNGEPFINGKQFVFIYEKNIVYTVDGLEGGHFEVASAKVKIKEQTDTSCTLDILSGRGGEFDLKYIINNEEKVKLKITIKSV